MWLGASKKDKYMERINKDFEIKKREWAEKQKHLDERNKLFFIEWLSGRIIDLECRVSYLIENGEFEHAILCFEKRNAFYEANDDVELDVIKRVNQRRKFGCM